MTSNSNSPTAFDFAVQVERFYAALSLIAARDAAAIAEPGLGGKLFYAGELDAEARALLVAANIAGAASLTAADPVVARQSMRDGVVDFAVNSLDEALRILKNQIRKRETVAVCVAAAPEAVTRAMRERAVAPDLVRTGFEAAPDSAAFIAQGAVRIEAIETGDAREREILVAWSVASAPALWLPKLDAIAAACLDPESLATRRWLRLAPRYLGRLAPGVRLMRCDEPTAQRFSRQVREQVECAEIGVPVGMRLICRDRTESLSLLPLTS